jgi:predicted AAA+ superfamily ATPase
LVNLSSLGSDAGVSHTTAREWLTLLETSFIILLLEPYHANIRKRLVRSPKIYFYDVGLAAYLLGIEIRIHIAHHPLRGSLFENMALMEFLKYRFHRGRGNNLSFFRDRAGHEIDILYAVADKLLAVEVKSGETVVGDFFKGFAPFEDTLKGHVLGEALIYGGKRHEIRNGIRITDVVGIKALLDEFV